MKQLLRETVHEVGRVGSREVEDWIEVRRQEGVDVLTLRGGPVLPLPEHVRAAVVAALDEPDRRPSQGLPELREAIAGRLAVEAGAPVDPVHEVIVTNGAMHALNIVVRALVDAGDEVVIPTPNYFFDGVVRLAGGKPVHVLGSEDEGWPWDVGRIEAAVTERTKLVLVSNPTNPTGFLPSRQELRALTEIGRRHGCAVLSDESYDRFVYDGNAFTSLAAVAPGEGIVVRSLSKSHALAAWRVGYVVARPELARGFRNVLEWDCLHCAYVPQRAAHAALTGPQEWLAGVPERYEANRDRLLAAISESEWLSARKPASAPFLFLDTRRVEAAVPRAATELLLELGIPTVDGEFFGAPGHARLPIGADETALSRLEELLAGFRPG